MRTICCAIACLLAVPAGAAAQDFVPAPSSPEAAELRRPSAMVSADFNKDGKGDVAFVDGQPGYGSGNGYANKVEVMLATAGGDFADSTALSLPALPYSGAVAGEIVAGDFNGDMKPDLAVAQFNGEAFSSKPYLTILLGDGSGGFNPAAGSPFPSPTYGASPELLTANFNGDANQDLFISADQDGYVLLGNGSGGFTSQPKVYGGSCNNDDAATGDFNSDGKADLALSDNEFCGPGVSGGVQVFLGNGDGTLSGAGRTEVQEQADSGGTLLAARANGDSHADILNVGFTPSGLGTNVLLSNGLGAFEPVPSGPLAEQRALSAADLSGDPISDVVASYTINYAPTACVRILDGQASGTFAPTAHPELVGGTPSSAAAGDFDGDGDNDLAVGWFTATVPGSVAILLNQRIPGGGGAGAGATCDAEGKPVNAAPPGGGGDPPPGGGDPPPSGGGGGGGTQPPPPGPTVTGPAGNPLGLPRRRRCVDTRKFSFRLHHAPGARIVKVEVFINGKRKLVRTGTNIRRLTLKRLPKKKFKVRIVATQNTGSQLISVRTYKGCKKSKARTRRGGRRR